MHRGERGPGWLYGHLPLIIGIIGTGAAVRTVVAEAGEPLAAGARWLLVGSVALALASTILLTRTLAVDDAPQGHSTRTLRRAVLPAGVVIAALLIAALGFTPLGSLGVLASITIVSLGLVTLSVRNWLRRLVVEHGG